MIKTQFTAGGFPVYKAEDGDYSAVSAFLNTCRDKLDRIEFFYPYTPEELKSVISGGGFLCAVDGKRIVGAFALDTDKSYGKMLADNVKECTRGTLAPKYAFETSGLMVDENYRRRGMAGDLADAVIALGARLVPDDFLCGVVQLENVASMSTFLSKGFVLAGVYSMGGEYDFGYFVRPSRTPITARGTEEREVPFRVMSEHKNALASGFVGVEVVKDGILYRKFE
mgnify:FL=1